MRSLGWLCPHGPTHIIDEELGERSPARAEAITEAKKQAGGAEAKMLTEQQRASTGEAPNAAGILSSEKV